MLLTVPCSPCISTMRWLDAAAAMASVRRQSCSRTLAMEAGHARASPFPMLETNDALALVLERADSLFSHGAGLMHERIALDASAAGRVLAKDVVADQPVPEFDASLVDGYAVTEGGGVFDVASAIRSDAVFDDALVSGSAAPLAPGSACYVTTGSPIPPGTFAMVKVEDTEAVGEAESQVRCVKPVKPGQNIRGSGSDVLVGDVLGVAGEVVTASQIGSFLMAGVSEVIVTRALRVGVLSTGDELVATKAAGHRGVVDANRPMLLSLLQELPGVVAVDLGSVRDERGAVKDAMERAVGSADVVVTTGGVSMGDRDFIKPVLSELGEIVFGRIRMKPGKPTTCAVVPPGDAATTLVFGLPGNPVSAFVTFQILVKPAIRRILGGAGDLQQRRLNSTPARVWASLGHDVSLDSERDEYRRAVVFSAGFSEDGVLCSDAPPGSSPSLVAVDTGSQQSSRLQSLHGCNALLCLPTASKGKDATLRAGSLVPVLLLGAVRPATALAGAVDLRASKSSASKHVCGCGMSHEDSHHHSHGHAVESSGVTCPVCIITVSDSCASGTTPDRSGPALAGALGDSRFEAAAKEAKMPCLPITSGPCEMVVVPDDIAAIRAALVAFADREPLTAGHPRVIITSGGTGFTGRDVTPEATLPVLHKRAPGLVQAMLAHGLEHTPMAALSRYEAGVRHSTLIVNMPGSCKAVRECLEALVPLLPHLVKLLGRDSPAVLAEASSRGV
jgi:gephyrin